MAVKCLFGNVADNDCINKVNYLFVSSYITFAS
jgi:hypothetical protein